MKNFCLIVLLILFSLMQTGCSIPTGTSPRIKPETKDLATQSDSKALMSDRPVHNGKARGAARGERVLKTAQSMLTVPYRWGGKTPRGFDCSGLVFYTYKKAGIPVPRTSVNQLRVSKPISLEALRSGDLVFFRLSRRKMLHVGIYAGNGQFVHAPSPGKVVSYAKLDNPFWRKRFIRAGRFD